MRERVWSVAFVVFLCLLPMPAAADFADVSADFWAYEQIEGCVAADIVRGYTEDDPATAGNEATYGPSLDVTRDQMAVYISRALAGGDSSVPEGPQTASFVDVPNTGYGQDGTEPYWAYKYIEYAVSSNVVQGYEYEDTENPGETIHRYEPTWGVTRDQMAVYIARAMVAPSGEAGLADYTPSAPENIPDVPTTGCGDDGTAPYWAYKHIEYCVENGVVFGYDDGYYRPEEVVTRDQMAVYVARTFGLVNPFCGTYSAAYSAGSSGSMTIAVEVNGAASIVIMDSTRGLLEGAGTVSNAGALTGTAQKEGTSISVGLSGQFVNQSGTIVGSGVVTGSISADWTAQRIADLGVNAFAGNWSGMYWGSEGGPWEAVLQPDGSVSATAQSPSVGPVVLVGRVAAVGSALLEGEGEGIGGPFTITWEGTFYMDGPDAVGEGTWHSTSGYVGYWSGERQ